MARKISDSARRELVQAIVERYRDASRSEKARILDEFVKLTGYHRKHAVRLLNFTTPTVPATCHSSQRVYDEAVRQALVAIWEAADRICGKRLKVAMPEYVESLERHGHLSLDDELRRKLLTVSAATIDRILSPMRLQARGRTKPKGKRKPGLKSQIPIRTFGDWDEPIPGHFESDFVAHNGGSSAGNCVHSLVLTDVASGWTECAALLVHEQSLVVEALDAVAASLPVPLLGIDTDNDSVFMNDTVVEYCSTHNIELTRSRAYLKNDQAWVEQKNGSIVRRFVGHHRFCGILTTQVLGRLYGLLRLYVNFFQPSFKLREKKRDGAHVHKTYFPPMTPCERLLHSDQIGEETKRRIGAQKAELDPVVLIHTIREFQEALCALAADGDSATKGVPASKSLDEFLEQLPHLWKAGEVRATHRKPESSPHNWRTRADPFETVWPELLSWLERAPDITATDLFSGLQTKYPGSFVPGQLRTLQRRVQAWRRVMARELIGISFPERKKVP